MQQSRQIAAALTFLVCGLILVWLFLAKLRVTPLPWPVEEAGHISMAELPEEEFIEVKTLVVPTGGDDANAPAFTPDDMDNASQPAPESGTDRTTQGAPDTPVKEVTQKNPSPVQQQQKPTPATPAAAIDNKKAEEEKKLAQQTQSTVSNAFAKTTNKNNALNGTADDGNAGKKSGNVNSTASPDAKGKKAGSATGTVGGGWKIPAYSRSIPSNDAGSVTFEVVVEQDGSPGKISVTSNRGLSDATIEKCRQEIRSHKFTHSNMETAHSTTARITFTFRDPVD